MRHTISRLTFEVKWFAVLAVALLMPAGGLRTSQAAGSNEASPPGLYVDRGVLMKDGHAYRGVGANYFSLFSRLIAHGDDRSSLDNLGRLSQAGIPFVRFACIGFQAKDMELYRDDKKEYFRRLDLVVREAEKQNIGLIANVFWNLHSIPDAMGESMDRLGDDDSKSIAFIRSYTEEVVSRYKDSPAIWGWEFANEAAMNCDLPASRHEFEPALRLGSAGMHAVRMNFKFSDLKVAMDVFARTVRRIDSRRLLSTGNAMPRPSAYHNSSEDSWKTDSEQQFGRVLLRDNPDPYNVVSVHAYTNVHEYYVAGVKTLDTEIGLAAKYAGKARKPLFLAEFGGDKRTGAAAEHAAFAQSLNAIEKYNIPLAAFWVFDLPTQDTDWSVTFDNDRAYMIEAVAKFNQKRSVSNTPAGK